MNEHHSNAWLSQRSISGVLVMVLVVASFSLGYYLSGTKGPETDHKAHQEASVAQTSQPKTDPVKKSVQPTVWTCSMHPQIRLPKPGKCPICFMDLIPLESDKTEDSHAEPMRYTMSESAKKLAEVATTAVKREPAKVNVRMFGMVSEDETRIATLTARIDGRLDEIYVNFTGERVNKGDPMVGLRPLGSGKIVAKGK